MFGSFLLLVRLIVERVNKTALLERSGSMENGASSYRRFLDGDDSGFVEIVKAYKDGLIFFLDSIVRNAHVAEELMEETFVKLIYKKPRFSGNSSFKTWLYAIARNIAIDWLRKSGRNSPTSLEEVANYLPDEADLEREYLREEQKIAIHRAMRRLKPDQNQALYLVFFEDLSNAEVATIMKKSKRQIEKLIYHAKRALKTELNKEGIFNEEL